MAALAILLRQATLADDEFCYQLHKATLGEYVDATWGWDDVVQREYHARAFDPSRWQIVTVDGADAGMMVARYEPDAIHLDRIEILPSHQGHGVGAHLIRQLLTEATDRGQRVHLEVLVVNHRAHALYIRLGFRETGRSDTKIRMASGL